MLELPRKDPVPINELARALNMHTSTPFRWGSPRGVRGCRLRLTRIGGRTYVYHADWRAFERALNKDQGSELQVIAETKPDEEAVDAELDAAGL